MRRALPTAWPKQIWSVQSQMIPVSGHQVKLKHGGSGDVHSHSPVGGAHSRRGRIAGLFSGQALGPRPCSRLSGLDAAVLQGRPAPLAGIMSVPCQRPAVVCTEDTGGVRISCPLIIQSQTSNNSRVPHLPQLGLSHLLASPLSFALLATLRLCSASNLLARFSLLSISFA